MCENGAEMMREEGVAREVVCVGEGLISSSKSAETVTFTLKTTHPCRAEVQEVFLIFLFFK